MINELTDRQDILKAKRYCLEYLWRDASIDELYIHIDFLKRTIEALESIDESIPLALDKDVEGISKRIDYLIGLFDDIKTNDVLMTKDGRRIGNSIVLYHDKTSGKIFIKTDHGNTLTVTKSTLAFNFHHNFRQATSTHKHYVSPVEVTHKYTVRLEFNVRATEFLNIEVFAENREDAIRKALDEYHNNPDETDMYASDYYVTTLDTSNIKDWNVEEIEKCVTY